MKTMLLPIRSIAALFAILSFPCNPWTASALMINITQSPYNASPLNAPVLNGATDNGTIINQAITNLRAQGGGTIYIPAGNWKFATPISITNVAGQFGAIIIRGDGAHLGGWQGGTDLIFTTYNGSDAFTVNGQSGSPTFNIPRIFIRDLAIDGGTQAQIASYATLGNHYGLLLESAEVFQLSGVTVSGFQGDGICINNSYYGSLRDVDVAYCGTGIDCLDANATHLYNVSAQYCTTGIHNPQNVIGCDVENNSGNGIVYDTATGSGGNYSIHDAYFANNNLADASEGTDIFGNSANIFSEPLFLSLSGHCVFMGNTTKGEGTTYPYRRMEGNWAIITRTGASKFIPTSARAQLDLTGVELLDASTENTSANVSWTTASGNAYLWDYATQTITVIPH